jgi:NTE family protein
MILDRLYRPARIGLALSGGGARGLAHIGVLKVLERENIPIHCLAGTSAGGLIGAAYAAGMSVAQLEAEALEMSKLRNLVRLMDRSLPHMGLLAGQKIINYLAEHIGYKDFAELKTPLALMAVDLESGNEVILDSGSVIEAVRATISFPGVFAPCEMAERLLVDGGLLNNLPVDVSRKMGAEAVIAVDVSGGQEDVDNLFEAARQWRLGWPMRSTASVLTRCLGIIIGQIRQNKLAAAPPDVLIRPEMRREIGLFTGFPYAAEAIVAGGKAANEALPQLKALLKKRARLSKGASI